MTDRSPGTPSEFELFYARVSADFDLVPFTSWGLTDGEGQWVYGAVSGRLPDASGRTPSDLVLVFGDGNWALLGRQFDPAVKVALVDDLQEAVMDLLRRPFPDTRDGVLRARMIEDGSVWWVTTDGARVCEVGGLAGIDDRRR